MGIIGLNTINLDGGNIIKKCGGSTPTPDTPSKPKWTGHADAEGLKSIGWTDEDIAYYQENGVNWNEEDDEYHKVNEENKALYGVLTASNISSYKTIIVYLPKIDTSGVTNANNMFSDCARLMAIPMLDTSNVTQMARMFQECYSLTSIPPLDTSSVTNMDNMFFDCRSLMSVPMLNTSNVTDMGGMFNNCYSLSSIPILDTSHVTDMSYMFQNCYSIKSIHMLNTNKAKSMVSIFVNCSSLTAISHLDVNMVTSSIKNIFSSCYSLTYVNIKNVKASCELSYAGLLTKDSLLYLINNEAATSAITITLASYAYNKWANDPDIVAALANHPNISLASV